MKKRNNDIYCQLKRTLVSIQRSGFRTRSERDYLGRVELVGAFRPAEQQFFA